MRVYRWEHKNRHHGPLCVAAVNMGVEWWQLFKDHNGPSDYENFMSFWDTLSRKECSEYFFGWASIDLLIANLKGGSEDKLEELGFEIREYESYINHICMADAQVAFHKASASLIE